MWKARRESPIARGGRQQFESGGRDTRTEFRERERPRRDEQRTEFRERSRSPECWDRFARLEIHRSSHRRHGGNLGTGRASSSAGPSNLRRSLPPPPRQPSRLGRPRRARQAQAGGKEHSKLGGFLWLLRAKNGSRAKYL